jgi:hypothetical protein
MMRNRLDPIGFTYFAAPYCYECGLALPEVDPEGNTKGAIAPWDEFHGVDDSGNAYLYGCDECGEPIQ